MIKSSKPLHEFNEKCAQIMTIVGEDDWKEIVDSVALIFFKESKDLLEAFMYGKSGENDEATIFFRAFGSVEADTSMIKCWEILSCIYGKDAKKDDVEKDKIIGVFYGYIIDQSRIALGKAFMSGTYNNMEEFLYANATNIQRISANIATCLVKKDMTWLDNEDNDKEGTAWY